ncbi:MAG: zinc-dependent alcohol dehydrogenase family protein [Candidatus Rokubacteria bacterium]|nr:zinc-dependent alcohol dehydrogenase family protein [Candidatus Rokubacteria bacterium]
MRCVRFDRFGDPAEVLQVHNVPTPSPGPGEALVRMRARPINPSDLLTVRGFYGVSPQLPATPGYEGMGVIEAVGPDVRGVQVGQRVIPLRAPGTWQEFLVVKAGNLVPAPDSLSDESAAQFVVNPLSAWIMVTEELALQPGQWLLQTAAGSTLGRIVLQVAKLRNVKTINVVRRREQAQELKALGADQVICTEDEDLVQRVMAVTNGAGVPAAIDAVGGQVAGSVVQALGPGGVMLSYGLLSLEPILINGALTIFRTLSVRGFWLTAWFRRAPAEKQRAVMGEVLSHMAKGEIVPPVEAKYDLGDITEAVRHAERPGRRGKVLLVG